MNEKTHVIHSLSARRWDKASSKARGSVGTTTTTTKKKKKKKRRISPFSRDWTPDDALQKSGRLFWGGHRDLGREDATVVDAGASCPDERWVCCPRSRRRK